jgi:predicted transcriptional regulator of viral defense system
MRLSKALAILHHASIPVIRTNDAAALWCQSRASASKALARMADDGHIRRLIRGVWLIDPNVHPWSVHAFLSEPAPSYISLQTALYHHGMIEQIPSIIHMISPAKTRSFKTPLGTFAMHQVAPQFFCGFSPLGDGPAQIACPEKALVDFYYFRLARSRGFRDLPELTLSKSFSKKKAIRFAALIQSASRKSLVERLISEVF